MGFYKKNVYIKNITSFICTKIAPSPSIPSINAAVCLISLITKYIKYTLCEYWNKQKQLLVTEVLRYWGICGKQTFYLVSELINKAESTLLFNPQQTQSQPLLAIVNLRITFTLNTTFIFPQNFFRNQTDADNRTA